MGPQTVTVDELLVKSTDALESGDIEVIEEVAGMLLSPTFKYIGDSLFAVFPAAAETTK